MRIRKTPQGGSSAADDQTAPVLSLDREFWEAYNACDTAGMGRFFTEDVEFYHDVGGPLVGVAALVGSIRTNLCSGDTRVRREAVGDTVQAFPLRRNGVLYGAILSGDHRFYQRANGRPEALTGIARFTHLWLLDNRTWRMARVLSYDHRPAP